MHSRGAAGLIQWGVVNASTHRRGGPPTVRAIPFPLRNQWPRLVVSAVRLRVAPSPHCLVPGQFLEGWEAHSEGFQKVVFLAPRIGQICRIPLGFWGIQFPEDLIKSGF